MPNSLRAYGTRVDINPFDTSWRFGIDSDHVVHSESRVPTEWKKTTGTVVHLKSHVPTEWEKTHLPIILLTSKDWSPSQEVLCDGDQSCEFKEMRMIHSLTSGMTRRQINAIRRDEAQGGRLGDNWMQSARHDIELQHGMILYDFTEQLISAINIATAYIAKTSTN
jgi:hypothetical protein